jgi:DNA-binding transcriptional LysR family regulator
LRADRDNIATFVEVIRRNSLAAAARHLEVPKSTVSRRLGRLEEQLGTKLVHRDARRITPTPEGTRFYDSVVDAIDVLDTAVATIEESTTEPRGTIRVTAPSDLGRMLLGQVTDPNLIARKLLPSDFQLAAHPGNDVDCDDITGLEAYPFVLYRRRGQTQVLHLEKGQGEDRESVELTVSGRVNVDDYTAMVELVAAGQGVGLMPELHVAEGERAGRLVRIFPEWVLPAPPVHLVYSTRQLPERVRLLIDFLCDAVAGFPATR